MMPVFSVREMDYIHFICGLSFLVMGLAALVQRKDRSLFAWRFLGLFGFIYGAGQWVRAAGLAFSSPPVFTAVAITLSGVSFVFLCEFARRTTALLKLRGPGWWIYIPSALAVAAPVTLGRADLTDFALHYSFGFVGALWTAYSLRSAARIDSLRNKYLTWFSWSFAVLPVLIIMTLPRADFVPVSIINYSSVRALTGLAPHIPLALLGFVMTLMILGRARVEKNILIYRSNKFFNLIWLYAAIGVSLALGWLMTDTIGRQAERGLHEHLLSNARTILVSLDVEKIKRLRGTAYDYYNPNFKQLREKLLLVSTVLGQNIYLTGERASGVFFFMDIDPGVHPYENRLQPLAVPGQSYPDASADLKAVFRTGRDVISRPYTDLWGRFISAYCPVIDTESKQVVAVLGLDLNVTRFEKIVAGYRLLAIGGVLLVVGILIVFVLVQYKTQALSFEIFNSKELYRSLVEGAPYPICLLDTAGRFLTMNRAGLAVTQMEEHELVGRMFIETWPADVRPDVERSMRKAWESGQAAPFDGMYVDRKGKKSFWHTVISPICDGAGTVLSAVCILTDTTELKRAERALSESEGKYEAVVSNLPDIALIARKGLVVFVNRALRDLTQFDESDVLERPVEELLDAACREQVRSAIRQAEARSSPPEMEVELITKAGALCPCVARITPLVYGGAPAVLVLFIDVAGMRKAEEAVRESEEKFRAISAMARDAIILVDQNDTVVFWNNAARKILQYEAAEMMGENLHRIIAPHLDIEHYRKNFSLFERAGGAFLQGTTFELTVKRKDGVGVPVELSVSAITIKDRSYAVGILRDISERKDFENRLRQNIIFLQKLIDSIPNPVYYKGPDLKFQGCNQPFQELVAGLPKESIIGKTVYDLFNKEQAEIYQRMDQELLTRKGVQTYEMSVPFSDGEMRFVKCYQAAYTDMHGRLAGFIGLMLDITEHKRVEDALRESENRLQSFVSALPDVALILDETGMIADVLTPDHALLAAPPQQVIGRRLHDIFPAETADQGLGAITRTVKTGQSQVVEYGIDLSGSRRWFEGRTALLGASQKHAHALVVWLARDVTRRKEIEQEITSLTSYERAINALYNRFVALERSELGTAIEAALAHIGRFAGVDESSLFLVNPGTGGLRRAFSWRSDAGALTDDNEILSSAMPWIVDRLEAFESAVIPALGGLPAAAARDRETLAARGIGSLAAVPVVSSKELSGAVWFECRARGCALPPEVVSLMRVAGEIMINALRNHEYEVTLRSSKEQAERANREKTAFIARLSHQLRTPLNAIIGMAELGSDTVGEPARGKELVEFILESAGFMVNLINDVIDFSSIEAGRIEIQRVEFSPREVADSVVRMFSAKAASKGIRIFSAIDADLPPRMIGDPYRIKQILLNLTGNAIRATETGEIAVRLESSPGGPAAAPHSRRVRFSVTDTGPGMPADLAQRFIDEAAGRGDQFIDGVPTAGLGLAITRSLAHLMGGVLGIDSVAGRGTIITLDVVLGVPSRRDAGALTPDFSTRSVLLVDDSSPSRFVLSRILSSWGLTVHEARSVREALESMRRERLDAIVLNSRINDLDALTVAGRLRVNAPAGACAILILVDGAPPAAAQLEHAGVTAALPTPINQSDLFNTLLKVLDVPRVAPGRSAPAAGGLTRTQHRVLLVEDNKDNQFVAARLLEQAGYKVTIAANGREAIDRYPEDSFSAVLMDIQMPEMDGFEAAAAVRALQNKRDEPRVPIIAYTAHAMDGYREQCLQRGFDDFITKPVRRDRFLEVMDAWMRIPCVMLVCDDEGMRRAVRDAARISGAARVISAGRSEAVAFYAIHAVHAVMCELTGSAAIDRQIIAQIRSLPCGRGVPILAVSESDAGAAAINNTGATRFMITPHGVEGWVPVLEAWRMIRVR